MRIVVGKQKLQILIDDLSRQRAKAFAFLERQFEHGTAQVLEQDQQMIGIDQRLLRGTIEKIFGVMRQELVKRTRGGNHDRSCGFKSASGATRLLSGGGDRARITDQDRRAQPADVDSQFEGVRSYDSFDRSVA